MAHRWVAVSGGFDCLHVGHLSYFEEARKLGDRLFVILNTDDWLMKKKGYVFMPYEERAELIQALECVSLVEPQIDDDMTVVRSLELYKPAIFAKGGDRVETNTPEFETCKELGIEVVFGVGGTKELSSSTLLEDVAEKIQKIKDDKCAADSYKKYIQKIVRDAQK